MQFATDAQLAPEDIRLLATAFNAHQPIAIIDRTGVIIKANQAFSDLTGYRLNELHNRNISILRSEKQDESFYQELWLGLKKQGFWEGELWNRTRNGDTPHHVNITAVTDEQGRFTHYVAFYEDLTGSYEQQHYLQRKAREESTLSILMALSLDSVSITDYLNQCQARLQHHHHWQWRFLALYQPTSIGLRAQLQHGSCSDTPCVKVPLTLKVCQQVIDQGIPQILPMQQQEETRCLIEQDHIAYAVPLQQTGQPSVLLLYLPEAILDTSEARAFIHRVVHVLGMGINKRMTEQALIEAKERAEKASQAKSSLLSSVSHELRTPLNAILGFSQLLQDDELTEQQTEAVREIHTAGSHLLAMVNDILDLARIESGRVSLNSEALELTPELNACLASVQPMAERQQLQIRLKQTDTSDTIIADRVRLKQVLLNLLSNAIKYNRPGGRVELSQETCSNGMLRLNILDTGIGIAEEKQQYLFQAFNRLGAEQSDIEGSGIGLALCQRLTHMMQGRIGYRPNPEGGSIFWLELPQQQAQAVPDQPRRFNILCVDDDPLHLQLLENALQSRDDIRLFTENNASYALDRVQKQPPDLILLYTDMPDLNGLEILEILQAGKQSAEIPVLAITPDSEAERIQSYLQAGFIECFTKPLSLDKLLLMVDQLQQEQQQLSDSTS